MSWIGLARIGSSCRSRKFRTYTKHSMLRTIQARDPIRADCAIGGCAICPVCLAGAGGNCDMISGRGYEK
ncbi:hypothetical protein GCM10008942_17580 [Rhizomicrobium electricum]|uniref:Uncharacterized protein n=1 Tax=Rhizomicrobium electricum TaxID=480070 RepID=A0ABN1END1_9PROT